MNHQQKFHLVTYKTNRDTFSEITNQHPSDWYTDFIKQMSFTYSKEDLCLFALINQLELSEAQYNLLKEIIS